MSEPPLDYRSPQTGRAGQVDRRASRSTSLGRWAALVVSAAVGVGAAGAVAVGLDRCLVWANVDGAFRLVAVELVVAIGTVGMGVAAARHWRAMRPRPVEPIDDTPTEVEATAVLHAEPDSDSPPVTLEYGRPRRDDRPATPTAVQAVLGFLTWAAALGGCLLMFNVRRYREPDFVVAVAGLAVVATVAFGSWVRVRYRWRGFLPGVLIGLTLTCLVPVGLFVVVCGGGLR